MENSKSFVLYFLLFIPLSKFLSSFILSFSNIFFSNTSDYFQQVYIVSLVESYSPFFPWWRLLVFQMRFHCLNTKRFSWVSLNLPETNYEVESKVTEAVQTVLQAIETNPTRIRRAGHFTILCCLSPSKPRQNNPELSNCISRTTKILQSFWLGNQ